MIYGLPWQHVYGSKPSAEGWYPVLLLWDSWEGHLPDAARWNGDWPIAWVPISHFIDRHFDTEDDAKAYAVALDPKPK